MSPNRLASETSPYLLQHAENPVDWYPWGPEAFEAARRRDVPVLISIGYAACHWCHVMERESFEDASIAAIMNDKFVCVKVDREERPDIDTIYMDALQTLSGHGGWPMTVFASPDAVPMVAGTYFPPEPRHGMPSFQMALDRVHELWTTRRDDMLAQGADIVSQLAKAATIASAGDVHPDMLSGAASAIRASFDAEHGGFGGAPKFPQAPVLELALRLDARGFELADVVQKTLEEMAIGGIYDQIGGGFARYAVDRIWLVPHFEKMLYDNAQLVRVYTHAWQAWKNPLHKRIATETLEYLIREMRDEVGAFHASEDADSEGVEGKFYVWDHAEFTDIAPEAADWFGITPEGNWEGTNIPTGRTDSPPPADARKKLYETRSKRVHPGRDDKILTSWNGLAIAALAEAGAAFGRPDFIDAARDAADFVLSLADDNGRLLHSYRAGKAQIPGLLEDVAYLCDGLVELWNSTFEPKWIDKASELIVRSLPAFTDELGGFCTVASDAEQLIVRTREVTESATPSPGAVFAGVVARVGMILDEPTMSFASRQAVASATAWMQRAPMAVPTWIAVADGFLNPAVEIAFSAADSPTGRELRDLVHSTYLPGRLLAGQRSDVAPPSTPLLEGRTSPTPTVWVCRNYSCSAPATDLDGLRAALAQEKLA